jgi:hypothetical protein
MFTAAYKNGYKTAIKDAIKVCNEVTKKTDFAGMAVSIKCAEEIEKLLEAQND